MQLQLQLQLQRLWRLLSICVCNLFLLNILIKLLLLFFSAHFLIACVPSQLILLFCQQRFIYLYWWPAAHTQTGRQRERDGQSVRQSVAISACLHWVWQPLPWRRLYNAQGNWSVHAKLHFASQFSLQWFTQLLIYKQHVYYYYACKLIEVEMKCN